MTPQEKGMKELFDSMDVKVIPKSQSLLMKFIGLFSRKFMTDFWTTYRLPFGSLTIAHPDDITNPYAYQDVLAHEAVHCTQFSPWYGPWRVLFMATLFPLPVLFSGRWFIERKAYLRDIRAKCLTIQDAVDTLWSGYIWPWPKGLMTKWFTKEVARGRGGEQNYAPRQPTIP